MSVPRWDIYEGPRNKSSSTRYLEYIVADCLHAANRYKSQAGKFLRNSDTGVLYFFSSVLKRALTLTDILLDHHLDFEQFDFTEQQLDQYVELIRFSKYNVFLTLLEEQPVSADASEMKSDVLDPRDYSMLHLGEKLAIQLWTGDDLYQKIQTLLRTGKLNDIKEFEELSILLTTLCVLSKALQTIPRQAHNKKLLRQESVSSLGAEEGYRKKNLNERRLVINKGFTAASSVQTLSAAEVAESIEGIRKTVIFNEGIAKDITGLSLEKKECESLFPPRVEFQYTEGQDSFWIALPLRSVNRGEEELTVSKKEALTSIARDLRYLQLDSVAQSFCFFYVPDSMRFIYKALQELEEQLAQEELSADQVITVVNLIQDHLKITSDSKMIKKMNAALKTLGDLVANLESQKKEKELAFEALVVKNHFK